MADTKISALTALTAANAEDVDEIAIVDDSATETKRMTVGELKTLIRTGDATLTDGTNISWNLASNYNADVTLAGNRTLDNPTNMEAGGFYTLKVVQDATGSRTLAYGSAYKWFGGVVPVLSTTANAVDILFFYSDGTNMYGSIQRGYA